MTDGGQRGDGRPRLATVAGALAAMVLACWIAGVLTLRPPAALSADADRAQFSAGRALAVLARLLGDGAPHPLGSREHAALRHRLLAELHDLGLEPEVQSAWAARPEGAVARVHNVVARIDGERSEPALLLAAHYDSVGAGPGACDDGAAVAAMLETARAVLAGPRPRHPIVLLVTDGEELGLFGARAFCAEHPWAEQIAAVLNFEARGTGGPSMLFETCGADLGVIETAARELRRPIGGSLFATVYRALPNGTDLSVFRDKGWAGANFAFIEGVQRYHTPLDDLAHVSADSLQHHGEQMLALARALAAGDLGADAPGQAVFFDLFGRRLVVWSAALELPIAAGALLLWVLVAFLAGARRVVPGRRVGLGCAAALAGLLLPALAGLGTSLALRAAGALPTPFPIDATPAVLAHALAGIAIAVVAGYRAAAGAGPWGVAIGLGSVLAAFSTALAVALPTTSHPFAVPALAGGAVALVAVALGSRGPAAAVATMIAIAVPLAVLTVPLPVLLPTALGAGAGAALAPTVVVPLLPALLLLLAGSAPRWASPLRMALVTALAAGAAVALSALRPAFDDEHPPPMPLTYLALAGSSPGIEIPSRSGRWTPMLRGGFAFAGVVPWREPAAWIGSQRGARADLPPPAISFDVEVVDADELTVTATVRSLRDAPLVAVLIPPLPRAWSIAEARAMQLETEPAEAHRGWRALLAIGVEPDEEVEFEVRLRGPVQRWKQDLLTVTPWVMDRSFGLPEGTEEAVALRRAAGGVPAHLGDTTMAAAPVRLTR